MNRRGKRIAFTVAAAGLAVVLVVGILYRDGIRDHVEAWRFVASRKTQTFEPLPPAPKWTGVLGHTDSMGTEWVLHTLADFSGRHVIFDPTSLPDIVKVTWTERSPDMASLAIKSLKEDCRVPACLIRSSQ
jgi:hypothetical protein